MKSLDQVARNEFQHWSVEGGCVNNKLPKSAAFFDKFRYYRVVIAQVECINEVNGALAFVHLVEDAIFEWHRHATGRCSSGHSVYFARNGSLSPIATGIIEESKEAHSIMLLLILFHLIAYTKSSQVLTITKRR